MRFDLPRFQDPPLQNAQEHDAFIAILRQEQAHSYLVIGAMHGCSLWKVAMALSLPARIVAIDSMIDRPEAKLSLDTCIIELRQRGYYAHFIWGDSADPAVIDQARKLGPYDALFIDGNHSAPCVLADWLNYGPLARIVAFHDINYNDTWRSAVGRLMETSDLVVMDLRGFSAKNQGCIVELQSLIDLVPA